MGHGIQSARCIPPHQWWILSNGKKGSRLAVIPRCPNEVTSVHEDLTEHTKSPERHYLGIFLEDVEREE